MRAVRVVLLSALAVLCVASFSTCDLFSASVFPDYLPRLTPYPGRGTNRWSWDVVRENSEHETAAAVLLGLGVMFYLFLR